MFWASKCHTLHMNAHKTIKLNATQNWSQVAWNDTYSVNIASHLTRHPFGAPLLMLTILGPHNNHCTPTLVHQYWSFHAFILSTLSPKFHALNLRLHEITSSNLGPLSTDIDLIVGLVCNSNYTSQVGIPNAFELTPHSYMDHTKLVCSIPSVKLIGVMFKNRCWPIIFHTIIAINVDGWCHKWLVWSTHQWELDCHKLSR